MPTSQGRDAAPAGRAAFLLAQVGALAAQRFADRVAALDLAPADAGLLRAIASRPGASQRELASHLGMFPSRVVTRLDDLEQRGLVQRRRSDRDRRQHVIELTAAGRGLMGRLREVAQAHGSDLCAPLDATERATLIDLLERLATAHELTPGVHPGHAAE